MPWNRLLLYALLVCGAGGCRHGMPLQTASSPTVAGFEDGSYVGTSAVPTPQLIRVAVDISAGRIAAIRLLEHPAWRAPAEQEELLKLIVASQSTQGLVPRGTGNEQDELLRAVDDALTQAEARRTAPVP